MRLARHVFWSWSYSNIMRVVFSGAAVLPLCFKDSCGAAAGLQSTSLYKNTCRLYQITTTLYITINHMSKSVEAILQRKGKHYRFITNRQRPKLGIWLMIQLWRDKNTSNPLSAWNGKNILLETQDHQDFGPKFFYTLKWRKKNTSTTLAILGVSALTTIDG